MRCVFRVYIKLPLLWLSSIKESPGLNSKQSSFRLWIFAERKRMPRSRSRQASNVNAALQLVDSNWNLLQTFFQLNQNWFKLQDISKLYHNRSKCQSRSRSSSSSSSNSDDDAKSKPPSGKWSGFYMQEGQRNHFSMHLSFSSSSVHGQCTDSKVTDWYLNSGALILVCVSVSELFSIKGKKNISN